MDPVLAPTFDGDHDDNRLVRLEVFFPGPFAPRLVVAGAVTCSSLFASRAYLCPLPETFNVLKLRVRRR